MLSNIRALHVLCRVLSKCNALRTKLILLMKVASASILYTRSRGAGLPMIMGSVKCLASGVSYCFRTVLSSNDDIQAILSHLFKPILFLSLASRFSSFSSQTSIPAQGFQKLIDSPSRPQRRGFAAVLCCKRSIQAACTGAGRHHANLLRLFPVLSLDSNLSQEKLF